MEPHYLDKKGKVKGTEACRDYYLDKKGKVEATRLAGIIISRKLLK